MPKMKTHRGAAKRFKRTGSGKIARARANKQHILTKKTSRRKRRLRKSALVHPSDAGRIQHMVPTL